jgi:SAM-dependent methyltransferase
MTVTDCDEAMVNVARARLATFADRVTVRQADATEQPFPDGRVDAVLSFMMLHHVINWEAALGEAVRVLRPGGVLIGYDLAATRIAHWMHQAEHPPPLGNPRPAKRHAYRAARRSGEITDGPRRPGRALQRPQKQPDHRVQPGEPRACMFSTSIFLLPGDVPSAASNVERQHATLRGGRPTRGLSINDFHVAPPRYVHSEGPSPHGLYRRMSR